MKIKNFFYVIGHYQESKKTIHGMDGNICKSDILLGINAQDISRTPTTKEASNPIRKGTKGSKRHFPEEDVKMAKQHVKRGSLRAVVREPRSETPVRYRSHRRGGFYSAGRGHTGPRTPRGAEAARLLWLLRKPCESPCDAVTPLPRKRPSGRTREPERPPLRWGWRRGWSWRTRRSVKRAGPRSARPVGPGHGRSRAGSGTGRRRRGRGAGRGRGESRRGQSSRLGRRSPGEAGDDGARQRHCVRCH